MAEVTAAGSPLMGAVNKIKDSAMHVFAQVRARARSRNATPRLRSRWAERRLPAHRFSAT